jgi:N-formylglutamate deformylase
VRRHVERLVDAKDKPRAGPSQAQVQAGSCHWRAGRFPLRPGRKQARGWCRACVPNVSSGGPSISDMTVPDDGKPAGACWQVRLAGQAVPLVACIPHGGRHFPAELASDLAVPPDRLWSDWLTRELYEFLPSLGVTTIVTAFSRYVADPNRDPAGEQHGSFWSSVVPAQTPDGERVYHRPLSAAEISHRIRLAHEPFHRTLDAVIADLLDRFDRVLLLDLHSFGLPLPADVILGDQHGVTANPKVVALLEAAFTANGFQVRRNDRFAGGWTVRRFAGEPRVDAVQVELNQRRYLDLDGDPYPDEPPRGCFTATSRLLRTVLAEGVIPQLPGHAGS